MHLSDRELHGRLEALHVRCREQGMPLTPQRVAIYRALLELDSHPDAETLYHRVRREIPNLSLATVYKNLEALEKLGMIRELTPLHEAIRFDANLEPHHHLVCTRCKAVMDLHDEALDGLQPSAGRAQGFVVKRVRVQVEGLCPACARLTA